MSARTTPKAAALEALIEAHAVELKLPTVKARFCAMAAEATREQRTPTAYLAALLEAEVHERSEHRERRRLIDARFPLLKRLEEFRFADNPKIPQATIAALAEGTWIRDRESRVDHPLIGDSGTGKTHLCQGSREFPRCDHGNSPPLLGAGEGGSERRDGVAVAAHAVAVAGHGEDGGVVQEPVEDGGRDGGVLEDVAPVGDPAVGGQDDAAVLVAAADDLEQMAGGFAGHREVAQLVNLCRYRHSST
jgi:IstB-like ATP binding protein